PEFLRDRDCFHTGSTESANLQLVPVARDEDKRTSAAIDLHVIEAAPTFVASAGQLAALQHARGSLGEFGQNGHPILQVGRLALAGGDELPRVRHETFHLPDQQMREINAVRKHVPQFAAAGILLHLAPAEVARPPILQTARTKVAGLAEVTASKAI